jgi:hypothetical protein
MAVRDTFDHRCSHGRLLDTSRAIEEERLEERARMVGPASIGCEDLTIRQWEARLWVCRSPEQW